MNDDIDLGGYVARARRRADLSQRELAWRLGVAPSTVARWESGARPMRTSDFQAVLRVAGLHLLVVDQDGDAVDPFDPHTVRDNAGRRFPAHLDVAPPDRRPANRGLGLRYDRPPARAWYALRPTRDGLDQPVNAPMAPRPHDHPTTEQLAARAQSLRLRHRPAPSPPLPECACPAGCYELRGCREDCPCGCEARVSP